jgi:hypothetical protein
MSSDVIVEQQCVTTMILGHFGNNTSQGHCCATMCFNDETGYSVAKVCSNNGNTVPIFRNNTLFMRVIYLLVRQTDMIMRIAYLKGNTTGAKNVFYTQARK